MNIRVTRVCVVGVVALAALTGCGKSKKLPVATSAIQSASPSPSATTGITQASSPIAISDLRVVTDGTDAVVELTMTNTTSVSDELVKVTSPANDGIAIYGPADLTSNAPSKVVTVPIPAKGVVSLNTKGITIDFGGTNPPAVGTTVQLTFTFKTNSPVTLSAPVLTFKK